MLDWENTSSWLVLVVDDEPDNVEVVAETLEFYGMSVRVAGNGVEAIEVLNTISPTLILCDLSMPQMDGWEARKRIKQNPATANIPIIALSAHAMVGDKERALGAGFDGYLTKPLNLRTLMDDLKQAFEEAREGAPE